MKKASKLCVSALALAGWSLALGSLPICCDAMAAETAPPAAPALFGNVSGPVSSFGPLTFDNTTVNDGTDNLLDEGGFVATTMRSSNSILTGEMRGNYDGGSRVDLTNDSVWNLTADSQLTILNNNASSIIFAPPVGGVFKNLVVDRYTGTGGALTLNATLGATGSHSDKLVLFSDPRGTTALYVNNVGGTGAQTTGGGIPLILVVATSSRASASAATLPVGAFTLSGPPLLVGGYLYTLRAGADDYALFSQPATTTAQATISAADVLRARQSQTITELQLGSILLGANEQVNCTNCASGFASVGSFALGAHGRWDITDRLTLLAGASYDEFSGDGYSVQSAPLLAASLRYDFVDWGNSRPFFDAGSIVAPYEVASFSRNYADASSRDVGSGSEIDRAGSIFGRAGWVVRPTPKDELAAYGELDRSWQFSNGYNETLSADNPYPASVPSSVDTMNIAKIGAQYTHLFNGDIEVNINGRYARAFDANYNVSEAIYGFGAVNATTPAAFGWGEFGARLGFRLSQRLTIDAFALGTVGAEPAGRTLHGGLGLRYAF